MRRYFNNGIGFLLTLVCVILAWGSPCTGSEAAVDSTAEKPVAVITRSGDQFQAKLIPRAKSTSITIAFKAKGQGSLADVKGVDFETVDRPEVDVKNFKSEAFEVQVTGLSQGAETQISLASDFFTASTLFYAFNPNLEKPWKDVQAQNQLVDGKIRELVIAVTDGGALDADGAVNGRVTLMGGPRDSFWGYALGTLFIRFFGIFIVLSILMVGMIISGLVFGRIDRAKEEQAAARQDRSRKADMAEFTPKEAGPAPAMMVDDTPEPSGEYAGPEAGPVTDLPEPPEDIAAVIALALHLQGSAPVTASEDAPGTIPRELTEQQSDNAWSRDGRQRMMADRIWVFRTQNRR